MFETIEQGSYADFKACVFRVCADRIATIRFEDIAGKLEAAGVRIGAYEDAFGLPSFRRLTFSFWAGAGGHYQQQQRIAELISRLEEEHACQITVCKYSRDYVARDYAFSDGTRVVTKPDFSVAEFEVTVEILDLA